MSEHRRARLRVTVAAGVGVVVLAAVILAGRLSAGIPSPPTGRTDGGPVSPADPPRPPAAGPVRSTLTVWSRPTTQNAAAFAGAFAEAIWTYDTKLPYAAWAEAIGSWADPLGSPASARVAMSMLPPPPAYEGLRAQSATATATIESVKVPEQAAQLRARAPAGWQVFVVRGTQHVTTTSGTYEAARQATVAVVCHSTCWLYSTTPELPQ